MIKLWNDETMSVTELIAELQKIPDPDNTPVVIDGCDCSGMAQKVSLEKGVLGDQDHVYIWRDKNESV